MKINVFPFFHYSSTKKTMPGSSALFQKFPAEIFVETGTYVGDGVQAALTAGFGRIYSIELSTQFVNDARMRFRNSPNVQIILGDSGTMLEQVLQVHVDRPATFWLDGHYSCGNTARGSVWSPLMQELQILNRYPSKVKTILVDDMRCWQKGNPEFGFGENEIIASLTSINPNFKFRRETGNPEYPNDVLAAY